MSGVPANFFSAPIRYLRWAAHEKPAIFFSCVLGGMGPPILYFLPKVRYALGDRDPPRVPHSYPVPRGPRKRPEGFEDP